MDKHEMNKQHKLFNLIKMLADFLPSDWRFNHLIDKEKHYAKPQLLGLKGAVITFRYHSNEMISVNGNWPQISGENSHADCKYWGVMKTNDIYPKINFNVNRQPQAIAKDMVKRFINNYQDLYVRCLLERNKQVLHRETVQYKIEAMKRVYPLMADRHKQNLDNPRLYLQKIKQTDVNGEVYCNYRGMYDIKLSDLSLNQTIKILAVLNQDNE
ncbi:MAG: hypothetical protein HRT38_04475 [Alteromonadaceae bacterium]|nr:hypothetical protein [Alteromonadaceae bacterium]